MISQDPSPSSDQPLLDEAIAEYLRDEAAGRAGNRQQWLDKYPECADELAEFFDDREGLDQLVMPIRLDQHGATINFPAPGLFTPTDVAAVAGMPGFVPEPPRLATTRSKA